MQTFIHYFLHLLFPALLAWLIFRDDWKKAYLIFLLTMLVDLDHLLASPIFQADRCSIGFHPLHSYYAIAAYAILLFFRKPYNMIGIGLLFHMLTDLVDCLFTYSRCAECLQNAAAYPLLKGLGNLLGLS